MKSNNRNGSRAASARGFMALCAMLVMGLGSMASPAEAQPFAQAIHQYHLDENPIVSGTTAALDSAGSLNGKYFGSITSTSGFGGAPNSATHFD
jgi:hypothetical protein